MSHALLSSHNFPARQGSRPCPLPGGRAEVGTGVETPGPSLGVGRPRRGFGSGPPRCIQPVPSSANHARILDFNSLRLHNGRARTLACPHPGGCCSSPRPRGQAAEGSRLSVLHCLAGEPAGRMAGSRVKAPVRIVRSPWPWRAQWHRWLEAVVTAELSVARGPHPCLLAARSLCWRAVSVPWESLSCACDVAVRHTPTLSRKESVVVSGVCPGIRGVRLESPPVRLSITIFTGPAALPSSLTRCPRSKRESLCVHGCLGMPFPAPLARTPTQWAPSLPASPSLGGAPPRARLIKQLQVVAMSFGDRRGRGSSVPSTGDGDPDNQGRADSGFVETVVKATTSRKGVTPGYLGVEVTPALRLIGFRFSSEGCFIFSSHLCK